MTKKANIENHLKQFKSITSWQAIELYGVTRLAAVIFELKDKYQIQDIWESNDECRWKKYIFKGVKK